MSIWQPGLRRRTWSAAVTPAIPFPITTTRRTDGSTSASSQVVVPAALISTASDTDTGPCTRAQHAMRVPSASPRRSSVLRSSAVGSVRFSAPSTTVMGSEPHTPIRQPASSASPPRSATSRSVEPEAAAIRRLSGMTVTSGLPSPAASSRIAAPSTPRRAAVARGAVVSRRTRRSFRTVRTIQSTANAAAARCAGQMSHAGEVFARASAAPAV